MLSSYAEADTVDTNMLLDACIKDENIEFCKNLKIAKDNGERIGNHLLKDYGLTDFAVIFGVVYKLGTEHKLVFVDKSNEWYLPGEHRQIELTQGSIIFKIVWPFL